MRSEEPNQEARKAMMKVARSRNQTKSFFISRDTGEIVTSAYRDKNSYFASIPKGTYEVHIATINPFFSYDDLQEWINQIMQRVWEEDGMQEQQDKELKELAQYSDERLDRDFGFSKGKIAELRKLTANTEGRENV
jgi:hypothetical protein